MGQLKTLGSFNSDVLVNGSADAFRRASAAAKALEVLAEAWRVGRGKPVDRQVIEDSGFVTDRFLEPVLACWRRSTTTALPWIAALEDGRVKGFRREAIANLQTHLLEKGHIDPRPPVPPDQIKARMLAAAAEEIAAGRFDPRGRVPVTMHFDDRGMNAEAARRGRPSSRESVFEEHGSVWSAQSSARVENPCHGCAASHGFLTRASDARTPNASMFFNTPSEGGLPTEGSRAAILTFHPCLPPWV